MATQPRIGFSPGPDFGTDLLGTGRRTTAKVDTRWYDADIGIDTPDSLTLSQLLPHQDLEAQVNAAIRPQVTNAQLLAPWRFVEALRTARETLASQANRRKGDGTARSGSLRRAVAVLDDHEALYAILWANRLALFQG